MNFCNTLCILLHMSCIASGSMIRKVVQLSREEWSRNGGCCIPTPHEDFKFCETQKRRALPVTSLGFRSISCRCYVTHVSNGAGTQTTWDQTFRQCLLNYDEYEVKQGSSFDHVELDVFLACEAGNLEAVKHILYHHPEKLHTKDNENHTAIMAAAGSGKVDVFNFLACHTCDIEGADGVGNTILHFACIGGSLDIVKTAMSFRLFGLDTKGSYDRTPVLFAVRHGHIPIAELLIRAGCDVTAVDCWGNNMLHIACKSENVSTLKFVMAKRLISLESRNTHEQTPLLLAARKRFIAGCEYLIKHGANVHAVDKTGDTWLKLIFRFKMTRVVKSKLRKYLKSKGYFS